MSALAEDLTVIKGKKDANPVELLVKAARESGQSPIKLALDFRKLKKGRGKLRLYEYMMYRLYDREKWSDDARSRFISAHIHWPTVNPVNDPNWWSVTEDKWLSSSVLGAHDLPIPENAAVFDRGQRHYPDVPKLNSADTLRDFLKGAEFPLFAKNMTGMWSAGAVRIAGCTDTHVIVDGRDPLSFAEMADNVFGDTAYLIQKCLKPHSFFEGITDAIATVRCLNLIGKDGLQVPFTLLKLPMGSNVADNFWRKGNLVCALDPETGEIKTIVANRNGDLTRLDALPGVDRTFIGEHLPHWDRLKEVNAQVALMHGANRYGSTDMALTEDGPVVVEVNNGCAFELVQIANDQGFLTDEILDFFKESGHPIQ